MMQFNEKSFSLNILWNIFLKHIKYIMKHLSLQHLFLKYIIVVTTFLFLFSAYYIPRRNINMNIFVRCLWTWSVIKFCMTSRWTIYLKRFIIHDYFKQNIHWMFLLKSNKGKLSCLHMNNNSLCRISAAI